MIPTDEQPYPLPDGWQWVTLDNVVECLDNLRSPVNATERAKRPGKIPYYGATGQVGWIDDFLTDEQLVLLGEDGAPFLDMFKDKAYIIEGKAWVNNHAHILRSRFGNVGNKFLCRYLNAFDFSKYVNGTTRLKLTQAKMKKIPIPLPPLDEQQRIVSLLDELFADLDEAKTLAQAVVDGSELRRAAILQKAFNGELSKLWRDEHGITLDSWQQCLLGDVCQINPPKISTRDLSGDLEVSFVPMAAVSDVRGEITVPQRKSLREVKSGFTNFSKGDVLFAKITPCMENGKAALVGELVNNISYGSTEFFVLRCGEKIFNRFVYHLVRWKIFRNKAKSVMAGAVGQQRVPKRFLNGYQLNLPPLEEQKEIVSLLDDLLSREQRTKEFALKTIERVELMKKSILARAFRGALLTK